jgi:hypothetical protein
MSEFDSSKGIWTLTQQMLDGIKGQSYEEGIREALSYLSDIFDGVEDTDLWAEYMKEEQK